MNRSNHPSQTIGRLLTGVVCVFVAAASTKSVRAQTPLGSELTYQGRLNLNGSPVNGTADFDFTLWDDEVAGVPINDDFLLNVPIVNGLFTVQLDFGDTVFNGDARWLDIQVASPAGSPLLTQLSPRQPITAVPYALQTRGIFVEDVGNVGIGTTNPLGLLHVARITDPNVTLENTNDSSGPRAVSLNFNHANGIGAKIAGFRRLGNDDGMELLFYTQPVGGSLTQNMVIDPNGNVGIGTDEPATALDVVGTVTATGLDVNGAVDATSMNIGPGRLVVSKTGPVGIGAVFSNVDFNIKSSSDSNYVLDVQDADGNFLLDLSNSGNFRVFSGHSVFGGDQTFANVTVRIENEADDTFGLSIRSGNAAKPGGGEWANNSDARLKDRITNFERGLDDILKINPVNYFYAEGNEARLPSNKQFCGVIAQELQQVMPECVFESEENGMLMVDAIPVRWAVVNAIQQQQELIQSLQEESEVLRQQIARMIERNAAFEARLAKLESSK